MGKQQVTEQAICRYVRMYGMDWNVWQKRRFTVAMVLRMYGWEFVRVLWPTMIGTAVLLVLTIYFTVEVLTR